MPVSVNLEEVVRVCAAAVSAAQQHIALDLLKLPELNIDTDSGSPASSILELSEEKIQQLLRTLNASVAVDVKAELAYKEGEASHDLVTTADVLTQAVIVQALARAFPAGLPFTIVGEEEDSENSKDAGMAARIRHCLDMYYKTGPSASDIPCAEAFAEHLAAQKDAAAKGVVTAETLEELRKRVSIYIDPIDGTNCFVTGVWQSPMTLVGIVVDELPVAAVVNRVFLYPLGASSTAAAPSHRSLSYVWNVTPTAPGSAFMVHEGHRVPLHVGAAAGGDDIDDSAALQVTQSSTTKASFLTNVAGKLQPSVTIPARGAGHKLFTVIEKSLCEAHAMEQRRHGEVVLADVFICPQHTICKWDTCAPHAFLYALGGEIYTHHGVPLRYPCAKDGNVHAAEFTGLNDGVVAVRKEAKRTVAARLGWPSAL